MTESEKRQLEATANRLISEIKRFDFEAVESKAFTTEEYEVVIIVRKLEDGE